MFENTEFILERNLVSIRNVGKASVIFQFLSKISKDSLDETP